MHSGFFFFYEGSVDLNSGPHAGVANTFTPSHLQGPALCILYSYKLMDA